MKQTRLQTKQREKILSECQFCKIRNGKQRQSAHDSYFLSKNQLCQAKTAKCAYCDAPKTAAVVRAEYINSAEIFSYFAEKLDKICSVARMKLAFFSRSNGDVAEWLKAAVC